MWRSSVTTEGDDWQLCGMWALAEESETIHFSCSLLQSQVLINPPLLDFFIQSFSAPNSNLGRRLIVVTPYPSFEPCPLALSQEFHWWDGIYSTAKDLLGTVEQNTLKRNLLGSVFLLCTVNLRFGNSLPEIVHCTNQICYWSLWISHFWIAHQK